MKLRAAITGVIAGVSILLLSNRISAAIVGLVEGE